MDLLASAGGSAGLAGALGGALGLGNQAAEVPVIRRPVHRSPNHHIGKKGL